MAIICLLMTGGKASLYMFRLETQSLLVCGIIKLRHCSKQCNYTGPTGKVLETGKAKKSYL